MSLRDESIVLRDEPGCAVVVTRFSSGRLAGHIEVRAVDGNVTTRATLTDAQAAELSNWLQRRTEQA